MQSQPASTRDLSDVAIGNLIILEDSSGDRRYGVVVKRSEGEQRRFSRVVIFPPERGGPISVRLMPSRAVVDLGSTFGISVDFSLRNLLDYRDGSTYFDGAAHVVEDGVGLLAFAFSGGFESRVVINLKTRIEHSPANPSQAFAFRKWELWYGPQKPNGSVETLMNWEARAPTT